MIQLHFITLFMYRFYLPCRSIKTFYRNPMKHILASFLILTALNSCANKTVKEEVAAATTVDDDVSYTPVINYFMTNFYPHDTTLFTEGFVFHNGQLFESSGAPSDIPYTKSEIGISDLNTGKFTQKAEIDRNKYFGEGITFFNNKLYQLTYKNQLGFIYDAKTFKKTGEFKFSNAEGWSLTEDGKHIIMSDGSNILTYLDPEKLTPVKTLTVTENGIACNHINELEYIKGYIYANIWLTNFIVKIDPANGKVVGKLDLTPLMNEAKSKKANIDVLNGIAYDAQNDKIYVTGKLWANIYQINFAH